MRKGIYKGEAVVINKFILGTHDDDDCHPCDVYGHDIVVLYALEKSWGSYVPRLIFENPWSWYPSIGMELGEK